MRRALIRNSDMLFSVRIHRGIQNYVACHTELRSVQLLRIQMLIFARSIALVSTLSLSLFGERLCGSTQSIAGTFKLEAIAGVFQRVSVQIALLAIAITANLTAAYLIIPETK